MKAKPEIETVLVIKSVDPAGLARKLGELASIGEYALSPRPTRTIHDIYLDTSDGSLKKRRLNLRVRKSDENYYVTLKQNPGLFSWKRKERQEIELPWSNTSLESIVAELAHRGVKLKVRRNDGPLDPVEMFRNLGMVVLQDRETQRTPREVTRPTNGRGEVLAELAVDSVVYHFYSQDVQFYELEIEAKSPAGRGSLGEVRQGLLNLYGNGLAEWKHGKLVTGKTIERMLREGVLQRYLDGSSLRAEAYNQIDLVARKK